jgi:YggT family protein
VDIIRDLLVMIVSLLMFLFFIRAIVSWLFVFGIRNEVILQINNMLSGITEPILGPIRRYVPVAGGLDLSFLVAVFGLWFVRRVLISL